MRPSRLIRRRWMAGVVTFGVAGAVLLALVMNGGARGVSVSGKKATGAPRSAAAPVGPTRRAEASSSGTAGTPAVTTWRSALAGGLRMGVRAADRDGGTAAAAVWVVGWPSPMVAGDDRTDRMWSISKAVAAIATLQAYDNSPPTGVREAMTAAIQRSDNCAERGVVLTLQDVGGADAKTRFDDVLARAGVAPVGPLQRLPYSEDGVSCPHDLQTWGIGHVYDSAEGFGTYSWTLRDAVAFAHALAAGDYGRPGASLLRLMRLHKEYGLEPDATADYSSRLDTPPSGGTFPAAWEPAYKGGWGGHAPRSGFPAGDFMAAQIVVVHVGGEWVALAARFWPSQTPTSDDPGRTTAPQALHEIFAHVQGSLETLARRSGSGRR